MHKYTRLFAGSTLLAAAVIGSVFTGRADAASRTEYLPCAGNDTETNCVWDRDAGEGDGFTFSFFVGRSGHVYRMPDHLAHRLIYGPRFDGMGLVPCVIEDQWNCVWEARLQGNGYGQSFFAGRDGTVYPLPHHVAYALLHP